MLLSPRSADFVQQTTRNSKPDEVTRRKPVRSPTKKKKIPRLIKVTSVANGTKSKLLIETTDRPGLLLKLFALKDLNLNVVQAEIDTIGAAAVDTMLCTYHGKALNSNMEQLVVNTSNTISVVWTRGKLLRKRNFKSSKSSANQHYPQQKQCIE